ncbi:MAG: T9SS type A sorting domain-containing protein [Bacteroidia bacterium]
MRTFTTILCILFLVQTEIKAQVARTQVVRASAIANTNGSVTLVWPQENFSGTFTIYRRNYQDFEDWGNTPIGSVAGNASSFTDNNVSEGKAFEYLIVKATGSTNEALGYIYAGNKLVEPNKFGSIILVIDSNYILPLQTEIERLQNDLKAEGWFVYRIAAGRTETPVVVKNRIIALNNALKNKAEALLLLGHIPVPYSGNFSSTGDAPPPDGHVEGSGNHTGAWPADVYYAILEDVFTDNRVTMTTGSQTRHHNIQGDGKFDQTKLPSAATLEVGRVDLFDMPAFGKSDTILTKEYLDRNHLWRTGQWKVVERALIDNNFTNLNLASTGYANFAALIGQDSVFDNRDYFTAQKNGSYLWSYGCGAGSYTSCSGIGNTNNFVNDSFENIFTILAGSYFGDWDIRNNFLRAPLASKSLASFWGGIPKWYVHHMGLGDRIGKGTKITMNNTGFYFTGNFNLSANSVHIALMGDPTLRQRNLPPIKNLTATSSNKKVFLNWNGNGTNSYAIYRVDTNTNSYIRVNNNIVTDTFFVDEQNYFTGNYVYAVKSIKLETTASGSYYNTGGAAFANVSHVNSTGELLKYKFDMIVYPNPTNGVFNINFKNTFGKYIDVEVFDLNGKRIYTQTTNEDDIAVKYILPKGFYIVKATNGENSIVKKLIVEE